MDSVTWVTYFGRKKSKKKLFFFFYPVYHFFYGPTAMEEIWNDYCNSNVNDKKKKKRRKSAFTVL